MASSGASAAAVGAVALGSLLAYSGLKGKGFSDSLRAVIAGGAPSSVAQANAIVAPTQSAAAGLPSAANQLSGSKGNEVFSGQTYNDFWTDVLGVIGRPALQGNLEAMAGISNFEGLNNYFNPMNIEWHPGDASVLQGTGNWNSAGVQTYSSFDEGVGATAYFLGEPHWAGVVTALTTGNYGLVNAAIKQAYSWAAYVPPSQAVADQILATPMGQVG